MTPDNNIDEIINKIHCGNCVEVMKDIPDDSIDLVVTSPPYDNLRDYEGYEFDFKSIGKELYRVIKKGGVVVWVVGDATIDNSETGSSFRQALFFKKIGFNLHDTMIWEKNSFAFPSHTRYHQTFEYMFIFSKGKPKSFSPISDRENIETRMSTGMSGRNTDGSRRVGRKTKEETKLNKYGMRFNIWKYTIGGGHNTKDKCAYTHPAIFPEQLAKDHILSWSNKGDLVLDPMCGSGTTCKMAKKLNRHWIGIDISQDYCDIARERLECTSASHKLDDFIDFDDNKKFEEFLE